jgi:ribonuclease HI
MTEAVAFIDGGNRGTPGPHACAVVLEVDGLPAHEEARYLGPRGTNNIAEYQGLLLALRIAEGMEVTHLRIRSDSKLIVEQVLGNWRVKQPHLRPLRDEARKLAMKFQSVQIKHVPRAQNKRADALCTAVLDEVTGRSRRP